MSKNFHVPLRPVFTWLVLPVVLTFLSFASVDAQLLETTGAMSVSAEMEGQSGKAATGAASKIEPPGKVKRLGQANAERNAMIEDGGAAPENPEEPAPAAPAPAEEPLGPDADGLTAEAKRAGENILKTGWWGEGGYFSLAKIFAFLFIFWFWIVSADWMNADMERRHVETRENTNFQYFLFFTIGSTAAFYIPIFWAALPVTFLIWWVPLFLYIRGRNKVVPEHDKVFTADHNKYLYALAMSKIGVKVKIQKKRKYETGVPVELEAAGKNADAATLQARLILARNAPGYNDFRAYLFDGIRRDADSIMFDFSPQKTIVRHLIDGVWLEIVQVPRVVEKGKDKDKLELALEAGKLLIGANPADRRSKQTGVFTASIAKTKFNCEFMSQGTQTGEAMVIQIVRSKINFDTLDDLGMNAAMQEQLRSHLNAEKGLFIISAAPSNGLRSSFDVFVRNCDRFTRDVASVEDLQRPERDIENIIHVMYDSAKKETPMTVLPDVFFKEPHVVIVRDMVNVESLSLCCREIANNRLILSTVKAKDAVEAMLRFLAMKVDPQLFASNLSAVIGQRLIRKLCPDCKEGFQPPPQLLQTLGFAPGSVAQLYRVRSPLPEDQERKRKPCQTCNDIGYRGRTALFELIEMNDEIRSMLVTQPNMQTVRQAVVKSRQPGFLQNGAELVRQGITSVDELSRILKM